MSAHLDVRPPGDRIRSRRALAGAETRAERFYAASVNRQA
jgi:hypothetical protein